MGPLISSPVQSYDILLACQAQEHKYVAYLTANKWARYRSWGGFLNASISRKQWYHSNNIRSTYTKQCHPICDVFLWHEQSTYLYYHSVLNLIHHDAKNQSQTKQSQLYTGRDRFFFPWNLKNKGSFLVFFFLEWTISSSSHTQSLWKHAFFFYLKFAMVILEIFSLESLKSFTPKSRVCEDNTKLLLKIQNSEF